MTKSKCVIYCRVSSREQEESGYSLDSQQKLLEEYADKKEFQKAKVFRISESANGRQIRKTFNEMLQYIAKNKVNIILCEKIDRLTRNLKDAAIVSDWIHDDTTREVHFVKENFIVNRNTRAHENLVWDMKVAIARFYTNNLSEEVKKGQKEKIAQGWLPTKPPLGYQTVGEKGHKIHILDDEKAPFIKRAFEYYSTGNYSLISLREKLYEEGFRTRNGSKLSKSRLEDILRDPFYSGSMRWNEVVYANGMHPPLISRELFEQVGYMLTRKYAPHYKRHLFQFTKMIKCGECGGTISGEISKGHIYYSCKHSRPCTQKGVTKEESIENSLIGVFKFFETVTEEEADEIRDTIRANHSIEAEYKEKTLKVLDNRYLMLQRHLDILYNDRLGEKISPERWESKQNEINTEQAEILKQIEKIKSEETKYFELYINILDLARRAGEIYKKRNPEEKRMLLQNLFSNLTVKDRNTTYSFKTTVEVFAKRVQEKIDLEKFQHKQNTAETIVSSGTLYVNNNSSLEPSEIGRNNPPTSRKSLVKPRPSVSNTASRPLLRR